MVVHYVLIATVSYEPPKNKKSQGDYIFSFFGCSKAD